MKRSEFHPIISVMGAGCSDTCMRTVLAFHLSNGWRIKHAIAAPPAAVPERFELKESIDISQALRSTDEPRSDHLALEISLEPTRQNARSGGNARKLQLGMSSAECAFGEHPVEIWLYKESEATSLASFQALAEDIKPPWAVLVSSLFRGPSLPEVRSREFPTHVSLERIFIADNLLADPQVRGEYDGLEVVRWNGGLFLSGDDTLVRQVCWPMLRRWALARR